MGLNCLLSNHWKLHNLPNGIALDHIIKNAMDTFLDLKLSTGLCN